MRGESGEGKDGEREREGLMKEWRVCGDGNQRNIEMNERIQEGKVKEA